MDNKRHESSDGSHQRDQKKEGTEANPIGQNIEAIVDLHKHAERNVSPQQRAIETVTEFLGRPRFLFIILIAVALWMLVNVALVKFGLPSFDPPPFLWLQGILTLGALLQATMILITQNRQDRVGERRMQLDLQVSLLVDQKISKLIDMVDGLRNEVHAGGKPHDQEAEAMKETVDPHQATSALEQMMEEVEEGK
jgi:uncharacterized membrane protein